MLLGVITRCSGKNSVRTMNAPFRIHFVKPQKKLPIIIHLAVRYTFLNMCYVHI